MPSPQPTRLPFPVGGVVRGVALADQPQQTTPHALNVWPSQPSSGRLRGGTRPSLVALGAGPGTPYHWCDLAWKGSQTGQSTFVNRGIAVVGANGTYTTTNGTWTNRIATDPGGDFASVAAFQQTLFQASHTLQRIYYYDMAAGTSGDLTTDATAGTPPEYAGVICANGGRLWVAGIKNEPHVVRGCKIGDFLDWDDSSPAGSSAFSTTGSGNSTIGEAVCVLHAHNHDCTLVGGPTSLYVARGNPSGTSGNIYVISRGMGPISMAAITSAGDGVNGGSYMLTQMGPYVVPPGCGEGMQPLGLPNIPDELVGVNPANGDYAAVGYDQRWRMVHFYVVWASGEKAYWCYQIESKSWWQISTSLTLRLAAQLPGIGSADVATVVPMTSGGQAYKFDRSSTGESIDSDFDYLIPLAGPGDEGLLTSLNIELAEDSSDVDYAVYPGASLQQAANATTPLVTGKFDRQGLNIIRRCRIRGSAARVNLSASGNDRLSIESLLPQIAVVSARRSV
jgi:hypothetical protein